MVRDRKKVGNPCSKRIKPLLKREVNNETFFTSPRWYYQIYYYSLLHAVYILFLVKDKDIVRNFNINKYLHLESRYAAIISLKFIL